jgi:hypothetical protein
VKNFFTMEEFCIFALYIKLNIMKILKKLKDIELYPSTPAVEVEVQFFSSKGKISEVIKIILPKAEYELRLYIQNNPISEELEKLIENYAEEKYNKASQDAAEEAAGEAL